jgi:DNA polymerase IV
LVMRWVLHVDMDAFFAAVEVLANPNLRGKSVIVGGLPGTRSTVAAASYEARRYGVRAGMSIGEAERRCPQGVFLPCSPPLYVDAARRIFAELGHFSARVEPASIDEAFVEVETDAPMQFAARVQAHLEATLRLSASIGISESKCLAKVASGLDKPHGLTFMPRERLPEMLWPRPVAILPGVGEKTAARLTALGFRTVGDLACTPAPALERVLGGVGVSLCRRARGEEGGRVTPPDEAPDAKSIAHEHTFQADCFDRAQLEALLRVLASRVGHRARRHGLGGCRVVLKIRNGRYDTHTRSRSLPVPVDDDVELVRIAVELLAETRIWEHGVRLVGLGLQRLVHVERGRQLALGFGAEAAPTLSGPPPGSRARARP